MGDVGGSKGGGGSREVKGGVVARAEWGYGKDDDQDLTLYHTKINVVRKKILRFPSDCNHCTKPDDTDMSVTDITNFKEVVIMSLTYKECGYRSKQIKGGWGNTLFWVKYHPQGYDSGRSRVGGSQVQYSGKMYPQDWSGSTWGGVGQTIHHGGVIYQQDEG